MLIGQTNKTITEAERSLGSRTCGRFVQIIPQIRHLTRVLKACSMQDSQTQI